MCFIRDAETSSAWLDVKGIALNWCSRNNCIKKEPFNKDSFQYLSDWFLNYASAGASSAWAAASAAAFAASSSACFLANAFLESLTVSFFT